MRNRLSESDYARVLSCIEAIHACRILEEFPQRILSELRKLIGCTLLGYNEVNLARNRIVALVDPLQPGFEPLLGKFSQLMHEHPVITYFDRTGDGQALKISDFLGAREFHRRAIYREVYRHMAVEDQMAIGVRINPGFMIGIAFARSTRTFTEKDRMRLNLVRPHIIQAYLHAEEIAGHHEHQRDLQTALRESGQGIIILDPEGIITHASPGALACLARYLPIPESAHATLPRDLLQWAHGKGPDSSDPGSFVFQSGHNKLIVRRVSGTGRTVLLVGEESDPTGAGPLKDLGLTSREAEVLKWLAEGKSNPEIATIFGCTTGTIKLHVERILAKLGVENRTAAALFIR